MTANGQTKLLYVGLLAALISGSACTQQSTTRLVSPDDATLDRVSKITAELLNVDASDLTATTSLGELGADELDFVELVLEIEDQFDISISGHDKRSGKGQRPFQNPAWSVTQKAIDAANGIVLYKPSDWLGRPLNGTERVQFCNVLRSMAEDGLLIRYVDSRGRTTHVALTGEGSRFARACFATSIPRHG